MLVYTVIFFVIGVISGTLGFGGVLGSASIIAKTVFVFFQMLTVLTLTLRSIKGTRYFESEC
jgi:uncharacterized membrane protein YtjA (UPF0391 family)